MKFENQFLTYDEYVTLGGKLNEMPFNILEFKARQIINLETQNRLIGLDEQRDEVKACIFQLVDTIDKHESQMQSKNVTSENTLGYSVSYANVGTDTLTINDKEVEDIVYTWLINCRMENGTPYLYRGVIYDY